MKPYLLVNFFALLVCVNGITTNWTQIRVKFAFSGILENIDSFWNVSNTLNGSLAAGWVKVNSTNQLNLITVCYTQTDVRVCPLYDANGFIGGMQLAIPPADVTGVPYNFSNFPIYELKTINGNSYLTSTYYVVNPTTLQSGGRTSFTKLGDGLWFKSGTSYIEVPTDEASIASSNYTKQNCLPKMGTHYYYNTTINSSCETFQPFFLMTKYGHTLGLGWQIFGRTKPVGRNWYDDINRIAVKFTVPNGPKCLADWTDKYGVISIHMYFIDSPWISNCDQKTESVAPILGFCKLILNGLYGIAHAFAAFRKFFHLY